MNTNTTKNEKLRRANRIKAAKAAKNFPTSILLEKKAECDAKALKIVQRLIEPNIEIDWFLESLGQISRTHMEDIAEERAIGKICGYVLCNNPLTKVVKKKYQISTLRNKVYDVEKVKNFCSYSCYAAMDHIMMQMLTSPLWLRNKEEIPVFNILPQSKQRKKSPPGVEINIMGLDLPVDVDEIPVPQKDTNESKEVKQNSNQTPEKIYQSQQRDVPSIPPCNRAEVDMVSNPEKIQINIEAPYQVVFSNQEDKANLHPHLSQNSSSRTVSTDVTESNTDIKSSRLINLISKLNEDQSKLQINSASMTCDTETRKIPRKHVTKKNGVNMKPTISYETLTTRIEKSFSEWITENTINLLYGNETDKQQIIDSVTLQDKYMVLCRKLNQIQLQEEKDDNSSTSIGPENLKPAPDYSALKEESKNLEIKVRAFYEGKTCIEIPTKDENKTEEVEESSNVFPLTDAHDPRALRRRIFLDKLNKVLPDLLHALIGPSHIDCAYKTDRNMLVKILITTFDLSATNIIFKTAEWTLVGLIIIKMLGVIDPVIRSLLLTKKATMYISMILMTYKLDTTFLDHLINSRIRSPKMNINSSVEGN